MCTSVRYAEHAPTELMLRSVPDYSSCLRHNNSLSREYQRERDYNKLLRSNMEDITTVHNELENLQMILLYEKGSHGACVRGTQRSISLPNCLESWTLKNHVQFICNSHTTTMCADPIGSGNMLTPSKTSENNWQLMRAQPKL